jgi:ACR3 family arsenite transporter
MVLVWNQLAEGSPEYDGPCRVQFAVPDRVLRPLRLVLPWRSAALFGMEAHMVDVDFATIARAVVTYLGVPSSAAISSGAS